LAINSEWLENPNSKASANGDGTCQCSHVAEKLKGKQVNAEREQNKRLS
jgi:hypothetical protein